jgi:hypothetical protein
MTDKAMPQLKQLVAGLSPRRPRLMPASMHVEFVVEKNGTGTGFSPSSSVVPSLSFHHSSPCPYIIWEMNNRPIGGRSSEILSHPTDMNNNNNMTNPQYSTSLLYY